jgi:ABC-type sugar transport system substrate-binding protein
VNAGLFLIDANSLFQKQQERAAIEAAKSAGLALEVFFAEGDCRKQREQIFAFVRGSTSQPAVLVEPVESTGLRFVAREAVAAGCVWVMVNEAPAWVSDLRQEFSGKAFIVTVDNAGIGRTQAEQFRALLPAGGAVLYVTGPPMAQQSQLRLEGVESGKGGSVSLLKLVGAWTEKSGYEAVKSWLGTTRGFVKFDLIAAQNDDMAVGARRAVIEAARTLAKPELSAIQVAGVDGTPEYGIRLVERRELAATVVMPTTTDRAIELLVGALRDGAPAPLMTTVAVTSYPPISHLRAKR